MVFEPSSQLSAVSLIVNADDGSLESRARGHQAVVACRIDGERAERRRARTALAVPPVSVPVPVESSVMASVIDPLNQEAGDEPAKSATWTGSPAGSPATLVIVWLWTASAGSRPSTNRS